MSLLFSLIETLEYDIVYRCKSYQYLHGNCGYYYYIMIRKHGEDFNSVMIVKDGILFDYLERVREGLSFISFTFKKVNYRLSETRTEDTIIILEHNSPIALN